MMSLLSYHSIPLLFVLSSPDDRVLIDRIVATVNDEIVTLSELRKAAEPYLETTDPQEKRGRVYRDIIEQLVDEKLIAQQIKEANIDVSEPEVNAAIEDILRQNSLTKEQLDEALRVRGMTMADYRADVKQQLIRLKLVDMKVRSRVVIPESDLRAEYEFRTRNEPKETKVNIAHIMLRFGEGRRSKDHLRVIEEAKAIRRRVTEGQEPFADVARAVSQGPTAAKGGGLGEMTEKALMPELAQAIASLEPGEISAPVVTADAVHVVKLIERRDIRRETFEELRGKIYQELFQERVDEQMKTWLDEVERSSSVEIRFDENDI